MKRPRLLHLAENKTLKSLWTEPFQAALNEIGEFTLVENSGVMSEAEKCSYIQTADIVLTGWCGEPLPAKAALEPGDLKYVCHLNGTLKGYVPQDFIKHGISVTNWGDALAFDIAEAALALLLACLKNLRPHIEAKRGGLWRLPEAPLGSMQGLQLGLYGFGAIGRKFAEICRPFGSRMLVYDPFVEELPDYVERVESLTDLFTLSQAVTIHASLTPQTHHSVGADLLRMLPDEGIVVNTARGAIIDQKALFAEFETGRLRGALDVVEEDEVGLPAGHPAHHWSNLILTAHQAQFTHWTDNRQHRLLPMHQVCLANLNRFIEGKPLLHLMDADRLELST